ncbi:MAG: VCBS repeat-containing protein [Saprospiraceae bacterium]
MRRQLLVTSIQKDLDAGLTLYCYTFETCWWENQGGKFVQHKLPIPVQASPIQGIICDDFNGDGNLDILMAGNKYGYEVETNPAIPVPVASSWGWQRKLQLDG